MTVSLLVVDGLAGNTERAETVQNGLLKATHLGKRGVNMQRAFFGQSVSRVYTEVMSRVAKMLAPTYL